MMMKGVFFVLFFSLATQIFATDYFVGGSGASDSNPGTAAQPFATIQKAASVAKSGDFVKIRAGVYRETITPASSGVVFQSDNNAAVVISGLNVIDDAGWTVHAGNIYKKSVTLPVANNFQEDVGGINMGNTNILANQLFRGGEMMHLARWPDISKPEDLIDKTKMRNRTQMAGYGINSLTDNGIPNVPGGLVGAQIYINGWFITQTRQVNSQNGTTLSYNNTIDVNGDKFRKHYYVCNKLGLLTVEKEWFYENGTLYFWQPGGGSPSGVEYKVRNFGFELKGKSNTTILNLQFTGCDPVNSDAASTNTTIDNIRASYLNHSFIQTNPGAAYHKSAIQTGTKLLGAGSVVKNSEFRHSGGMAVWLGSNTVAQNNLFYNIAWDGMYSAPIKPMFGADNIKIMYNTFTKLGRGGVEFTQDNGDPAQNIEIGYNDFSYFNILSVDGGAIYSSRKMNHAGSRVHHNWFHDSGVDGTGGLDGIQVTGVYFDQASGPMTIDHNVHWNGFVSKLNAAESSDFYTDLFYDGPEAYGTNGPSNVYNNTFASTGTSQSYVTYDQNPIDVQRNNIYRKGIVLDWGKGAGNIANSLFSGVLPQFSGAGAGGLSYRLNGSSPAVNAGVGIAGITDGSVGNPDLGAYEYGGTDWVPGYKAVTVSPTPNTPPTVSITAPATNTSVAQGTAITLTATAADANGSVSRVEFYDGTTKIGEDLTSPYSFTWNGATVGAHTVTARATDNLNATTTSASISITVTGTANTAPTVSITSPANNATSPAGTAITINATAADANGTVAKVEFFDGAVKLGEDTSSPYSFSWATPTAGAHTLTAKATDNQAGLTTSAAVTITITGAPGNTNPTVSISSPANNATSPSGTAITINATAADANGTVAKVEFFDGAVKLGEDTSSPYSYVWASPAGGVHKLTAKATDNQAGATTSAAVTVTITTIPTPGQNALPTVSITSPSDNATFEAGQDITITATATDSDGSIALVEFYAGSNKLGEDADAPYTFTWPSVEPGNHALTVLVTDNDGGAATSAPVDITVNTTPTTPPVVGEETDLYSGIPRFFSPNGDGSGDLWVWASNPKYVNASVQIYNRAGQLVYQSSAYNNSWDGKSDGQPLQDGDYYYVVRLADLTELRASVRIIR